MGALVSIFVRQDELETLLELLTHASPEDTRVNE